MDTSEHIFEFYTGNPGNIYISIYLTDATANDMMITLDAYARGKLLRSDRFSRGAMWKYIQLPPQGYGPIQIYRSVCASSIERQGEIYERKYPRDCPCPPIVTFKRIRYTIRLLNRRGQVTLKEP